MGMPLTTLLRQRCSCWVCPADSKHTGPESTAAASLPGVQGPYLAGYQYVDSTPISYGIQRVDHAVGNVHHLHETLDYLKALSGFHEFAEFTTEVGSPCQAASPLQDAGVCQQPAGQPSSA